MTISIFEFNDYKSYLIQRLDDASSGGGRGARNRLSLALRCPPSHTAQVLKGPGHFSLEHAELINDFLGHTEEQSRFFLFLVQYNRAGSEKLKKRFRFEMERLREARLVLANRLQGQQPLSREAQITFYSAWYYAAIHALISIPGYTDAKAISNYLQLDITLVNEALQFLLSTGMLVETKQGLKIGQQSTYLGSDSPLIAKHHTHWRLQAIRSVEKPRPEDLHYSSVVSLSEKDAMQIREMLTDFLAKSKSIIRQSQEEVLRSLALDFFQV